MEKEIISDFITWCSDSKKQLPVPPALVEKQKEGDATLENRKRTGAKEGLYPPQYFAGQYPDLWKVPAAADAVYYQKHGRK